MERRALLASGIGVIAGTAFVDTSGSGQLDLTNSYLPGATVRLFQAGSSMPIGSETTDTEGQYVFGGLTPGQYVVTETPPSGYSNTGTQVLSQYQPASSSGPAAIEVTIPATSPVYVNYNGITPNSFEVTNNLVDGNPVENSEGALQLTLGTSKGATDLSGPFLSYCCDDLSILSFQGGEQFQVLPNAISSLTQEGVPVSADHTGRIAFLYDHFGTSALPSVQSAALQLAIWELIYDTGPNPDFSSGNFQVVSPVPPYTDQATLSQVLAQATAYYKSSAGKSETAILLDARINGGKGETTGSQSVLATGSYNFANQPSPVSSLSGFVYCDDNQDGHVDGGDDPLAGVTVTLTGTDDSGTPVDIATQTDLKGAYHFLNLNPGVYTITQTVPEGLIASAVNQGTPGTGTLGTSSIDDIHLAPMVNGQNNDFGDQGVQITVTSLNLYGIHEQPSRIVLKFSGPLDAASADNPANYSLLGLGTVQQLGSATNYPIAISSAVYDPTSNTVTLSPTVHLNIHYHYLLQLAVQPANDCVPTVTSAQVFGRAQVPVWTIHGRTIPAPPMTPVERYHDQQIVTDTLNRLKELQSQVQTHAGILTHLTHSTFKRVSSVIRPRRL
jgi:hypothetical protein